MMNSSSIPWPRKGDQLFKSDVDWYCNACLNYSSNRWGSYVIGYKRAADLLVESIQKDHTLIDAVVYPIVFLYRQYIELQLKMLIRDGDQLLSNFKSFPSTHNINNLWKECRTIIEKLWPGDSTLDLNTVEDCIRQFSEQDPSSEAFRYPTDIKGKPLLPDLKHINLRNLSEVMSRMASLFYGVEASIDEALSNKQDMEAESREFEGYDS